MAGAGNGAPARPAESPWLPQLDKAGIPRTLVYPTTTLGRILDQTADRFGDATAVVYGDTRWTYSELLAQVNRMAGGLSSLGVRRGDRVLFTLPNCPEMIAFFLAVQKLGAVVVNAGPLMGADDLAAVMTMTAPRVAIGLDLQAPRAAPRRRTARRSSTGSGCRSRRTSRCSSGWATSIKLWHGRNGGDRSQHVNLDDLLANAPARPPTVEPDPSKVAVLQPTGGTTGTLKLAQLSHRNLLANATQIVDVDGLAPGPGAVLRGPADVPRLRPDDLPDRPAVLAARDGRDDAVRRPPTRSDIIRRERPDDLPAGAGDLRRAVRRDREAGEERRPQVAADGLRPALHQRRRAAAAGGDGPLLQAHRHADHRRLRPDRGLAGDARQPAGQAAPRLDRPADARHARARRRSRRRRRRCPQRQAAATATKNGNGTTRQRPRVRAAS